ncbi:FeoA family protein [Nostoc sp. MS1]|uniref:FeoA family protein n=1 Tax=Nostoc sp. MS1 TaxID=2764711 RepID=UPI001CC7AF34|nr:FeoA family protein [Nostoc sp. MS1]
MYSPFTVTSSSLELLKVGDRGIVKFCNIQNKSVLKKLKSLGLTTGVVITVQQDFPTLIITVGSILLEIDKELARSIYVRVLKS